MSCSSKVLRKFDFLRVLELLRKIKKKLKLTALLSEQSCQNKNSNVDNFFPEVDKNPPMSS